MVTPVSNSIKSGLKLTWTMCVKRRRKKTFFFHINEQTEGRLLTNESKKQPCVGQQKQYSLADYTWAASALVRTQCSLSTGVLFSFHDQNKANIARTKRATTLLTKCFYPFKIPGRHISQSVSLLGGSIKESTLERSLGSLPKCRSDEQEDKWITQVAKPITSQPHVPGLSPVLALF